MIPQLEKVIFVGSKYLMGKVGDMNVILKQFAIAIGANVYVKTSSFCLLFVGISVLSLVSCTPETSPPEQLDYRDSIEGAAGMYIESLASPNANLFNLGETSLVGFPQYAIKFSTDTEVEDSGTKNAILIECGMHAREWFAAESCYWLVDHLIENRDRPEIRRLWENVDIWILPQSNPAGREIDDLRSGDPTQYHHYCKDGVSEGKPCPLGTECGAGTCAVKGWRNNANHSACLAGVNLARNFSADWASAEPNCNSSSFEEYRGTDPFSELETLNIRRFVHNHMISMALIVHTTSLRIWHMWNNEHKAATHMVDELVAINSAGIGSDTEAGMLERQVGTSSGQFTAWLSRPSDFGGELDYGTQRSVSTFFFELPIQPSTVYETSDYDGDKYQLVSNPSDGSNRFHPSSSVWYRMWRDFSPAGETIGILPMFEYVIRQAESPACPLDDNFNRLTSHCETKDFGLVGMKISKHVNRAGALGFDPISRQETLVTGTYSIVFAVQNFSANSSNQNTQAEVRIYRDILGSNVLVPDNPSPVPITGLLVGERHVETVEYFFSPDETYRVEIELTSDDFDRNNSKSIAFQAINLQHGITAPRKERFIEEFEVRAGDPADTKWVFEGEVSLTEEQGERLAVGQVEIVVFPVRKISVPKPYVWRAPITLGKPKAKDDKAQDVSSVQVRKSSSRSAQLKLVPLADSDKYKFKLIAEDPILVKALAKSGKVSLRIVLDDDSFSISGRLSRETEPLLKVIPKKMVDEFDYEPK